MFLEYAVLVLIGLCAGAVSSAGIFAFFTTLGIVPRIAGRLRVGKHHKCFENAIILGGIWGCCFSVFCFRLPVGAWFLCLYGAGSGIYVGCMAVALAEVLHVFPVLFRRLHITAALNALIFGLAAGKLVGALYSFFF